MPRFYFDTSDGETMGPDEKGREMPDLAAARTQALEILRELAPDRLKAVDGGTLVVRVRDDAGGTAMLASLVLTVQDMR
jgi:hypothetical protein